MHCCLKDTNAACAPSVPLYFIKKALSLRAFTAVNAPPDTGECATLEPVSCPSRRLYRKGKTFARKPGGDGGAESVSRNVRDSGSIPLKRDLTGFDALSVHKVLAAMRGSDSKRQIAVVNCLAWDW
jgi:hypothetical protein